MGTGPKDEEITELILKIADRFAAKFQFGYHDVEDMKQQCCEFALEGLSKYDPDKGPMENFLTVHVRNQLINLKRKQYSRPQPPCVGCPFYDPDKTVSDNQCTEFTQDRMDCDKFSAWNKRNQAKKGLMAPRNIEDFPRHTLVSGDDLLAKEIFHIISNKIPIAMRADFNKMLEGLSVPKYKRDKIIEEAKRILEEHGKNK